MKLFRFDFAKTRTDMKASRRIRAIRWTAATMLCASALNVSAEIFYAGDTKGLPGEMVELSINARAGTTLESIQIVPEYGAVASVLQLIELKGTPALKDDSFGDCNNGQVCGIAYLNGRSFAADTLLATLRFNVAPDAPPGPVPFDPGVIVGDDDPLPIPVAQNFQVLAVPEPAHWALLLAGLGVVGFGVRQRMACLREIAA